MRSYVVFFLLVAMTGLFVVLQVTREPALHQATVAPAAGTGTGTGIVTPRVKGKAKKGSRPASDKKPAPKPLPPLMKRPLRVASLGWELIAPGVVANGGATPGKKSLFKKARLDVHLAAFKSMEELEAALARGGGDPLGADVAILSLPELVAAHERIRALDPQVFLVLGWSRGRDGLMVAANTSLTKLPRGRLDLIGQRGSSPTFFSLFVLELAGVPASRVRLIEMEDKRAKKALFAALERPLPAGVAAGDRKFLATTADAGRLVPVVAVAPNGMIKSNTEALVTWGQVWLAGVERLHADVPAAAREVAALKSAPHALDLLKRLGQIDAAPLIDNARLAGLSGRDPVALNGLFRHCWHIWRTVGVLSSPMPEPPPIHTGIMAAMVRTYPAMVEAEPPRPRTPAATRQEAAGTGTLSTLLVHRLGARRWERQALVGPTGFIAAVFGQAQVKVSVRDSIQRARELVADITARYDISTPGRLHPARHAGDGLVRVEIQIPQ